MSTAQRFSLRAAVTDKVSTGRREEPVAFGEPEPALSAAPLAQPKASKTRRSNTRQGARRHHVGGAGGLPVIKLIGPDADMITQDVMMEAINGLLVKKGKESIVTTR